MSIIQSRCDLSIPCHSRMRGAKHETVRSRCDLSIPSNLNARHEKHAEEPLTPSALSERSVTQVLEGNVTIENLYIALRGGSVFNPAWNRSEFLAQVCIRAVQAENWEAVVLLLKTNLIDPQFLFPHFEELRQEEQKALIGVMILFFLKRKDKDRLCFFMSTNADCVQLLNFLSEEQLFSSMEQLEAIGLLEERADVGHFSLLHYAAAYSGADVIQFLLKMGKNPNAMAEFGRTPLHTAVEKGNLRAVEALLQGKATDLNLRDHEGMTPLHLAIAQGEKALSLIKLLLDKGADINAQDRDGNTPLHYAWSMRVTKTVEELIKQRKAQELKNRMGALPDVADRKFEDSSRALAIAHANSIPNRPMGYVYEGISAGILPYWVEESLRTFDGPCSLSPTLQESFSYLNVWDVSNGWINDSALFDRIQAKKPVILPLLERIYDPASEEDKWHKLYLVFHNGYLGICDRIEKEEPGTTLLFPIHYEKLKKSHFKAILQAANSGNRENVQQYLSTLVEDLRDEQRQEFSIPNSFLKVGSCAFSNLKEAVQALVFLEMFGESGNIEDSFFCASLVKKEWSLHFRLLSQEKYLEEEASAEDEKRKEMGLQGEEHAYLLFAAWRKIRKHLLAPKVRDRAEKILKQYPHMAKRYLPDLKRALRCPKSRLAPFLRQK